MAAFTGCAAHRRERGSPSSGWAAIDRTCLKSPLLSLEYAGCQAAGRRTAWRICKESPFSDNGPHERRIAPPELESLAGFRCTARSSAWKTNCSGRAALVDRSFFSRLRRGGFAAAFCDLPANLLLQLTHSHRTGLGPLMRPIFPRQAVMLRILLRPGTRLFSASAHQED